MKEEPFWRFCAVRFWPLAWPDRALAADAGLPALIVAPFSGDKSLPAYWQPAMGEGLCEMLITELGKINRIPSARDH